MSESKSEPKKNVDTSRIARLFDIRLIVGGLLTLYGLILVITGLISPDLQPSQKSSTAAHTGGQHLNLWTGLGMLVVGVAMLVWMRVRPLAPPDPDELAETTEATEEGPQESRA